MADLKAVIATTVIHRAVKPGQRGDPSKGIPPKKPEVQIIRPGARFIPKDQAEYAELMKAKAIKLPEEPAATVAEAEAAVENEDRKPRKPRKPAKAKSDDGDNLV